MKIFQSLSNPGAGTGKPWGHRCLCFVQMGVPKSVRLPSWRVLNCSFLLGVLHPGPDPCPPVPGLSNTPLHTALQGAASSSHSSCTCKYARSESLPLNAQKSNSTLGLWTSITQLQLRLLSPPSSVQVMPAMHVPPAHPEMPGLPYLTHCINLWGMLSVSHRPHPPPSPDAYAGHRSFWVGWKIITHHQLTKTPFQILGETGETFKTAPAFDKLGIWVELECPDPVLSSYLQEDDLIWREAVQDPGRTKDFPYDSMWCADHSA